MHLYDLLKKRIIIPWEEAKRIDKLIQQPVRLHDSFPVVNTTIYRNINDCIKSLKSSSTFINLNDMLSEFRVLDINEDWELRDFFLYSEIILTIITEMASKKLIIPENNENINKIINNIKIILDKTNHKIHLNDNNFACIIENNKFTTEAIESIDNEKLAIELINYNRAILKGNIEEKRKILHLISNHIEPLQKSKTFNGTAYSSLNDDVGFYLNNFNIRHNNLEGKSKQDFLVDMPPEELEAWYDDIYSSFLMLIIAEKQLKINANLKELKTKSKVKPYTIDEALPAFQTNQESGEVDWGEPQGKEI